MTNIKGTVQQFLQYLTERDLEQLVSLFSNNIDWYIPGDEEKAPWLGRRKNKQEVSEFYELLWKNTVPVSASVDNIYFDGDNAVLSGEFSTKMLQTNKIVTSLFFIQITVEEGEIVKYRLLEDSYAVSVALN